MSDKERLIKLLDAIQDHGERYECGDGYSMVHMLNNERIADHLIANGVTFKKLKGSKSTSLTNAPEWISVDERLPEDDLPKDSPQKTIKVFVALKAKNGITIRTQMRFKDYTYRDGSRVDCWRWRYAAGDVTHWMPLPEPPKEGEE